MLAERSRFFADKLRCGSGNVEHSVEISEIEDVEVYVEVVVLMYCEDLKRKLTGEEVEKVLRLLKVLVISYFPFALYDFVDLLCLFECV